MTDAPDPPRAAAPDDRSAAQVDNCHCDVCRASPNRSGPRVMTGLDAIPGESLIGLVARAARRNHLPSMRVLLSACSDTGHAHINLAYRDDVDFGQLAYAARLAPHDIESRRYRSVKLTPDLPGVEYNGAAIPEYDLKLRPRRLAASWLVGEPSHCALGHHALATHCPVSGDLLFDRCERCDATLTWSARDLSHCGSCGFDLTRCEPQRITIRQLGATRLMLDLIHPDPAINSAAVTGLPSLLSGLDRGTVFELGWRLGSLLTLKKHVRRTAAKRLPVATRLKILENGSTVLATWPESVRSAMQGLGPGSSLIDPKLPTAVRAIARSKNAWPAVRSAIYAAVPGLEKSARAGTRSVLSKPANRTELTRDLRMGQQVFQRMRGADTLTPASTSGTIKVHQIFDAGQIEHLRSLFADRVPLNSVSERLNISIQGAEQLCCFGELQLLTNKEVIAGLKGRQITMSSFERLQKRLQQTAVAAEDWQHNTTETVPIHRAMRTFGGREKPWGPVILAMLSGELPFSFCPTRKGPLMNHVVIRTDSLKLAAALHFEAREYPDFEFDPRINGRDVEEMLNVGPTTFSRAMKNAEVPTSKDGKYDRSEIIRLALFTISASEVSMRWAWGERRLPPPLKGRDAPIRTGHLGWIRAEVERTMAGSTV